jgi:hypothetical protein
MCSWPYLCAQLARVALSVMVPGGLAGRATKRPASVPGASCLEQANGARDPTSVVSTTVKLLVRKGCYPSNVRSMTLKAPARNVS